MANKTHGADVEPVTPAAEPSIAAVLAQLVALQQGNQDVQRQQLKQTAKKSNEIGPKISPYNLRGDKDYPVAPLKCDVYAPWKESPTYHNLDREEVELFNLLQPGQYVIDMADGSAQAVSVVGVTNGESGKLEKMSLFGPKDAETGQYGSLFTHEKRQAYPSLKAMLRQMVGDPADGVMTMKREAELIKSGALAVSQGE